jgi:hypothetical protein
MMSVLPIASRPTATRSWIVVDDPVAGSCPPGGKVGITGAKVVGGVVVVTTTSGAVVVGAAVVGAAVVGAAVVGATVVGPAVVGTTSGPVGAVQFVSASRISPSDVPAAMTPPATSGMSAVAANLRRSPNASAVVAVVAARESARTVTDAVPFVKSGLVMVIVPVTAAAFATTVTAVPPMTTSAAEAEAVGAPVNGQSTADVMIPAVTAPPRRFVAVVAIEDVADTDVAPRVAVAVAAVVVTATGAAIVTFAPLFVVPFAAGAETDAVPPLTLSPSGADTTVTSAASAVDVPPTTAPAVVGPNVSVTRPTIAPTLTIAAPVRRVR